MHVAFFISIPPLLLCDMAERTVCKSRKTEPSKKYFGDVCEMDPGLTVLLHVSSLYGALK